MTREQQISYIMRKNPTMSYAQAVYYIDHVLGLAKHD